MNSNYCCYFDHRYLPRGLAMIRSLRRVDPAAKVWVLCLSEECHRVLGAIKEPSVELLRIADLEEAFPALLEARSNRNLIEYYFTCTPSLVRYVLERVQLQDVVTYVDGDLYFFSDPAPLFAELGGNSVSIIPHRFTAQLKHLEKFGLYNVGWMSFRNDPRGNRVATWWQDRCNEWCYDRLDGDRFADQKYLDRIATQFGGVVVLNHRGANLAPWNVAGHRLTFDGNRVMVDAEWPLVFFHFHGLRKVGRRLFIPGHFRYAAPFGPLIRKRIYWPYVRALVRIENETSGFLLAPSAILARSVSPSVGIWERIFGWLKQPVKNVVAITRGEFVIAIGDVEASNGRPSRGATLGYPLSAGHSSEVYSKLRIVVVHNYYGSAAPSGENNAVETEIAMLRRAGHDVHTFTRRSDEIRDGSVRGLFHGGLSVAWNSFEVLRFRRFLRETRPDVVHVHNTFPLISPAIFWFIREHAASVLTLHNYRLFCASALLLRDGAVCTRCLDESSVMPALRYGCYRGSRIATLPLAQSIALHKRIGTWRSRVDAFIAVTEFQRDRMVAAGLPAARLHVKPNFFSGSPVAVPWQDRNDVALFVGRLTVEKGVEYLVRGWVEMGPNAPKLRVVGEGPLRTSLEALANARGATNIEFVGAVSQEAAIREVSLAKLLIVPSIWFEGFPIVLQEAFAAGTPIAVSNIGSLPTVVRDGESGLVFEARSSTAIASLLSRVWGNETLLTRLGAGARASYESYYTEAVNHRRLMEIYALALAQRERSRELAFTAV